MLHFANCYTPDELKTEYRRLAKLLHPDAGGDKAAFQELLIEYKQAKIRLDGFEKVNTMPDLFSTSGAYEYFRRPVKYGGVMYNHYYKFTQDFGADILIDIDHINLIFTKRACL